MLPLLTGTSRNCVSAWRPDAHQHPSGDAVDRHRAEGARVDGVRPVVAEHEDIAGGNPDRAVVDADHQPVVDVALAHRMPVDHEQSALEADNVTGNGSDPLDEQLACAGTAQDDDVVPMRHASAGQELVDEDLIA